MKSQRTFVVAEPLTQARERMLGDWGMSLVPLGLGPHGHGEDGCNHSGDYRPFSDIFLFGLLSMLWSKRTEIISVELTEEAGVTSVEVVGHARRKVWRRVNRWT
jgi:hypothetical protein